MAKIKQVATKDDIRAAYSAIVDYHNNLVQMRFTMVGIFLATNGVLAVGFFQNSLATSSLHVLQIIGALLAVFFWVIEVRTYQLLENLGDRGLKLEKHLGLHDDEGFFFLMDHQPIDPRLLPTEERFPTTKAFSHSIWISVLYIVVGLAWLIMFIINAYRL